jgi:signal transduction histidine kinase
MLELLLPVYDIKEGVLTDGTAVAATRFCRKALVAGDDCKRHYAAVRDRIEGYFQCPFGFTSRTFVHEQRPYAITGVIAFPRFDTPNERERAKQFPANRVDRKTIEVGIRFLRSVEEYRADAIQEASKVLPQAFHELRKLNGAVIQHTEREIKEKGETRNLVSIMGAAELMRNNFDILEALSNIDAMRALPLDQTVSVFDLLIKTKGIFSARAGDKAMHISVGGDRVIIKGSRKSFPIVTAVLIENAIKYGTQGGTIRATCQAAGVRAILIVENPTDSPIDPERCFLRGARFSSTVEGGGFGLYLAKQVVEAHNGTIRCETGKGVVRMIVETPLETVSHR